MKTAQELGLNDKQFKGLHSTLAALKAGTIVHIEDIHDVPLALQDNTLFFNMNSWSGHAYYQDPKALTQPCGSVCCIGGTAEFIMNDNTLFEPHHYGENDEESEATEEQQMALFYLFYPWEDERYHEAAGPYVNGDKITLQEAIQALTNYLETGDANWPAVHVPRDDADYQG